MVTDTLAYMRRTSLQKSYLPPYARSTHPRTRLGHETPKDSSSSCLCYAIVSGYGCGSMNSSCIATRRDRRTRRTSYLHPKPDQRFGDVHVCPGSCEESVYSCFS